MWRLGDNSDSLWKRILKWVFVSGGGKDKRIWEPDEQGDFSVRSSYQSLMRKEDVPVVWPKLWKAVSPGGENFRLASWFGKVLMMDQLKKRRMVIINACPLCLRAEENVHHIFLH